MSWWILRWQWSRNNSLYLCYLEESGLGPLFFGLYLLRLKVLYVVIETVNNGLRLASLAKVLG